MRDAPHLPEALASTRLDHGLERTYSEHDLTEAQRRCHSTDDAVCAAHPGCERDGKRCPGWTEQTKGQRA